MQKQLALEFAEVKVTPLVPPSSLPFTIESLAAFLYASKSLQTTYGGHEFPRAFLFKRLFLRPCVIQFEQPLSTTDKIF